jgi:hypothetical protein
VPRSRCDSSWIGPLALGALLAGGGCYRLHDSDGGGSIAPVHGRQVDPADVEVPPGYEVDVAARGLTYPTAVAFDGEGRPYVIEGGYTSCRSPAA